MKSKLITGIVLALFLIGMLTLAFNVQPVKASGTIYIRADGSVDPDTAPISSADNINYTFIDNIYDSIVVERSNIIIDGNGYTLQAKIKASGNGFHLDKINNVTIQNVNIKNFYFCIALSESSFNTIFGNNISDGNVGILLFPSFNNRIYGNNLTNNGYGVWLSSKSSNNKFYHNNFIGNIQHVDLFTPYANFWDDGCYSGGNYWSGHICRGNPSSGSQPYIIDPNNIDHYPFQDINGWLKVHNIDTGLNYITIQEAIDAPETLDGHTILVDAGTYLDDVTIDKSISLRASNQTTLFNNSSITIIANNVAVSGFTFVYDYNGPSTAIFLEDFQNCSITDNIFTGLWYYCVYLKNSSKNEIYGNNIGMRASYGIFVGYESENNTISRNFITESIGTGIVLWQSSNNTLTENTIIDNREGIGVEYSNNTRIIHNNFINNTVQAPILESYNNTWDDGYPFGGNYWSNYTGVDSDHDGIGDTEHTIDANNIDNYPLIGMFHSFNTSLGYHVNVISNSRTIYFEYFKSNRLIKMYVGNTTTTNQTFGFCRVCVPHTLMDPEKVWIVIDDRKTEVLFANYTLYDNTTHRWIYFAYPDSTYILHKIMFGEDNTPPIIEKLSQQPANNRVFPDDKVKVNAIVSDYLSEVKQVTLNYTNGNGTWVTVDMTNLEGNIWNATIPAFPYCTNVKYMIIAEDNANNTITTEGLGYDTQYHVIPEFPTWVSMPLILIVLTVAIAINKRRLLKTPTH